MTYKNNNIFILLLSCLFSINTFAQVSNMTLLDNWDGNSESRQGVFYNDIWGYVDEEDNEYAIIGSPNKIHFLDVTNPSNATLIAEFNGGSSSIWRDFKTYDKYVYAVADEGNEGLIIFDMSALPNGNVNKVYQQNNVFGKTHNIYVDPPNGRLYVVGSDTRSGGLIIYDLAANPANPPVIANLNLPGGYVHDIFVQNNIAYCSHGNDGLYVYDFSNASSPVELANIVTGAYNHSSWITEDGGHLIYAEEDTGRPLGLIDLSGVNDNDLNITSTFKFPLISNDPNIIYHNPYIVDNYAIVSSYLDGVVIFDISNPSNPQRVAYYDTYPNNNSYGAMDGCWGVYPFFPSGNIIGSDTRNGLFILSTSFNLTTDCGNGTQDIFEVGVDCGGFCHPCGTIEPTCTDGIQNQGETGIDCGGPCAACPPTCTDGIQNGNETGVDCGGSNCTPCPTCNDGIQNQGETGIDCGGPCTACPASCTDGIQNGNETGVDCGGSCDACVIAYCTSSGNNSSEEWIERIQCGSINNFSSNNGGYQDFTNQSTDITIGGSESIILNPGYNDQAYQEYWRVWVDLNQDGDFEDTGELVFDSGTTSNTTVSSSISIPFSATSGTTRMRVSMKYVDENSQSSANRTPPTPCEEFPYGEVEDYTINILPLSGSCDTPTPSANVISGACVKLNWTAVSGAAEYRCRYKIAGGTWSEYNTSFNLSFLNDLQVGATYEFQVKSKCGGTNSVWSSSTVFTTASDNCDRPNTISHAGVTSSTARISWSNDPDDLKYKVGYKTSNQTSWTQIFVSLNSLTQTISGLNANTSYLYRVKTKCSNGWTNWTPKGTFTTPSSFGNSNTVDQKNTTSITLYPNPVNEQLTLEFFAADEDETIIQVFDLLGRQVLFKTVNTLKGNNIYQLNLSDFTKGTYLIRVQNNDNQYTRQFVKL